MTQNNTTKPHNDQDLLLTFLGSSPEYKADKAKFLAHLENKAQKKGGNRWLQFNFLRQLWLLVPSLGAIAFTAIFIFSLGFGVTNPSTNQMIEINRDRPSESRTNESGSGNYQNYTKYAYESDYQYCQRTRICYTPQPHKPVFTSLDFANSLIFLTFSFGFIFLITLLTLQVGQYYKLFSRYPGDKYTLKSLLLIPILILLGLVYLAGIGLGTFVMGLA
jgi:hypothetical protein